MEIKYYLAIDPGVGQEFSIFMLIAKDIEDNIKIEQCMKMDFRNLTSTEKSFRMDNFINEIKKHYPNIKILIQQYN